MCLTYNRYTTRQPSAPFPNDGLLGSLTSKNRFSHHTWNMPSPISTLTWKMLHHFTRALVLSAVLRCVRSRTTM